MSCNIVYFNYSVVGISSLLVIVGTFPFSRRRLKFSDKFQKLDIFRKRGRGEVGLIGGQAGVKFFREGMRVADFWRCHIS